MLVGAGTIIQLSNDLSRARRIGGREQHASLRHGARGSWAQSDSHRSTGRQSGKGSSGLYEEGARRITEHGHAAALVDFYARQGDLPEAMRAPERTGRNPDALARATKRAQQLSDERFLADMQTAVDDLHARGAQRVACWGFCSGGRLAYVSAARVTGLAGAVAYYGFVQAEPGRLSPLALAPEIRIPVLGVFGGADPGIPPDQIAAFRDAVSSDKEFVTYPGAPHGFLRYDPSQHQAAVDDALKRTFDFLGRVLTPV